ncbi:MAG: amino acid/polyamine/organocation transporter, superfamily [Frankiales bacterium]|nr:amino acid/polyamine/organocation transporter, superfamily [Frankiales bacterium]
MPAVGDVVKRIFIGRALASSRLGEAVLPKKIALPVFASDALSSVAYATGEILLVLAYAGTAHLDLTWYAAGAVVLVLTVVVAAYRQNVHAYPSGGGDYEVANTNLGPSFGLVVAAALLVDYVLTVAVSASAGIANLGSTPAFSFIAGHETLATLTIISVIVLLNLRGLRESGTAFAFPTYAFMVGILGMVGYGLFRIVSGVHVVASSAHYKIKPEQAYHDLGTAGLVLLGARAFAAGCTALTGVEAISNGVPAFEKPKSKNAATTLTILGLLAVTMFIGVTYLAIHSGVHYTETNGQLIGFHGEVQPTVIAQLGAAVFGSASSIPAYYVQLVTALILVLAANTAFNGFPVLASILAQDRYLPRQLHTRGDRLVFSNGILILAAFAMVLVYAFHANPTKLIQLYIVGVFVSFTLSQTGMVRHWNRELRRPNAPRRDLLRKRGINFFAGITTGIVLVVVLVFKFTHGAWIAVVAMTVFWFVMRGIKAHYDAVSLELQPEDELMPLPSRNHAIVLVSKIHNPTLRALSYAKATRPHNLTALTVAVDEEEARSLQDQWDARGLDVPLTVVASPYREITRPILDYVRGIRLESPRDVVTVFIPEYVVGHWWEQLLHNQSALRLKGRLLYQPGVMVTSVPYQLASSDRRAEDDAEGTVRKPAPRG